MFPVVQYCIYGGTVQSSLVRLVAANQFLGSVDNTYADIPGWKQIKFSKANELLWSLVWTAYVMDQFLSSLIDQTTFQISIMWKFRGLIIFHLGDNAIRCGRATTFCHIFISKTISFHLGKWNDLRSHGHPISRQPVPSKDKGVVNDNSCYLAMAVWKW